MDTRQRVSNTTPGLGYHEGIEKLEEWFEAFTELGINPTNWAEEVDLIQQSRRIDAWAVTYAEATGPNDHVVATRIRAATSYEDAIAIASTAVHETADDARDDAVNHIRRAAEDTRRRAWHHFKNRGNRVLDWFTGPLTQAVERVTTLMEVIDAAGDSGIDTLEHAAKHGFAGEWTELVEHITDVQNIETLIGDLYLNGVLDQGQHTLDRYAHQHFLWRNPQARYDASAQYTGARYYATAILNAEPAILTANQVDKIQPWNIKVIGDARRLENYRIRREWEAPELRKKISVPTTKQRLRRAV
ncbi:MAG: hypothetical protein ACK5LO_02370 [Leucobacter sp.]